MITKLHIENFALIESLTIDFPSGFSTVTGETGAGKSVLLGALGLILGNRADLSTLKDKEQKCVIEAEFAILPYDLQYFFADNDLEYDPHTIIRREILPSGKSRAFVNDSPVNLQQLQELGVRLVDIHSQHETLELADADFQFRVIDAIAGNAGQLKLYADVLQAYKKAQIRRGELLEAQMQAGKEHDFHLFLFQELQAANLKPGEQEELEAQQSELAHVETLRENLGQALAAAKDERFGLLLRLREFRSSLQKISGVSPHYTDMHNRAQSLLIELDDLSEEIERDLSGLNADPAALEMVNDRLRTLFELQKKHHVDSVAALIGIREELEAKTGASESLAAEIERCEKEISALVPQLDDVAADIHSRRVAVIPKLAATLTETLALLGMPDVRFQIDVTHTDTYHAGGKDNLLFLFSANKGGAMGTLKKVASGGEMSRIMLAVKALLAEYSKLPTIIFDEIDTGVSGEVANQMAGIMKKMSGTLQVMAITHLPQVAARGDTHFKVFKTTSGDTTASQLRRLSPDERVIEIAEMLSGTATPESAINHARALLN